MSHFQLSQEPTRCLTLRDDAFNHLLVLLKENIQKKEKIENFDDLIEVVEKTARQWSETHNSWKRIFNNEPLGCKSFYKILTPRQLKILREFAQSLKIPLKHKPFEEVLLDYFRRQVDYFIKATEVEHPDDQVRNKISNVAKQAWEKTLKTFKKGKKIEKGTLLKELEDKGPLEVKIAPVKVSSKTYQYNPWLLSYLIKVEPYGEIIKSMETAEEDVKKHFEKILCKELEESNTDIETLKKYGLTRGDCSTVLNDSRSKKIIDDAIEGLFEAIDRNLRQRLELEHFISLIKDAVENPPPLEEKKRKTFTLTGTTVLNNMELLLELIEENQFPYAEKVISVIPIGVVLLNKIADYLTDKNYYNFLYTYKLKVNDIAEGAIKQFLQEGHGKVKTRAEYFIQILKDGEKNIDEILTIAEEIEKPKEQQEDNKDSKKPTLRDYAKKLQLVAFTIPKVLFFYGQNLRKEEVLQTIEVIQQIEALTADWFTTKQSVSGITDEDKKLLKLLKAEIEKTLEKSKHYKTFDEFYGLVIKTKGVEYIKRKLKEEIPSFVVAVDFHSLARLYVEDGKFKNEHPSKTQRYRGIIWLLKPEEALKLTSTERQDLAEYLMLVEGKVINTPLDFETKIDPPRVEKIQPLREGKNWFSFTAGLEDYSFEWGKGINAFKIGYTLAFLILGAIIAKNSEGVFYGFSLPQGKGNKERTRDLLARLLGALAFATASKRTMAIQSFNWEETKIVIRKDTAEKAFKSKDPLKQVEKSIRFPLNKKNILSKLRNGLSSLLSNLPHKFYNQDEQPLIKEKVAVVALSNPQNLDKDWRGLMFEIFLFEPEENSPGGKVRRITAFRDFEAPNIKQLSKNPLLITNYVQTVKNLLEDLKREGVQRVFLIPPLPLYKGLSTKEELFKELYKSDHLKEWNEVLPTKVVFVSFITAFTEKLDYLKRHLWELLKKNQSPKKKKKEKDKGGYIALNLMEGLEETFPAEGALIKPKFGIIPLISLSKEEEKRWFHHAFIYSYPSSLFFGEKYSEYLNLTEEEKKLFVNLMDIIHSMRYERNEEDEDKNPYKTTKRNPFWVYPKSRSGDNNIFAETEIELYRSKEEKPKLQTAALAFLLMEAIF
jgi:hypothetical protein